jgi:hypothetical protein
MGAASFLQSAFLGGEWSLTAQGMLVDPRYKVAMSACLNGLPLEAGAWTRRPGTRFLGTTRNGTAGRLITFDFEQSEPYNLEFTDGYLRFWNGRQLAMTNDAQTVVSITANPALVQTTTPHGWSVSDRVVFSNLGINNPLLQSRVFKIATVTDGTHFTFTDEITGTSYSSTTLGSFVSGTVSRVLEIATIYAGTSWSNLRSVQAEDSTVLMNGDQQPQILAVTAQPTASTFATFSLNPFNFLDGPYLDPIDGSFMTPSALNGVVTMTLSTQAYDISRAYNIDDIVTSAGTTYRSLQGNNQAQTPATSPTYWEAVNPGAAIGPNGFVLTDVGRLVRMLSEPPAWSSASTYSAGNEVSYPSTVDGVNTYWTATGSISAGVAPGTSTSWALTPEKARWTWGRVTAISGTGVISPVSAIGDMSNTAAAFDGTSAKSSGACAQTTTSIDSADVFDGNRGYGVGQRVFDPTTASIYVNVAAFTVWNNTGVYGAGTYVVAFSRYYLCKAAATLGQAPTNTAFWTDLGAATTSNTSVWSFFEVAPTPTIDVYVGQHYGTAKAIAQATVYPAADIGFANNTGGGVTLTLRASLSAPSSPSSGTVLGTATTGFTTSAVTITSADTTTTWNYVWVELSAAYNQPIPLTGGSDAYVAVVAIAQVYLYEPNVSNGSVIDVQIEGQALLYSGTIRTWRLGVFSDTTGWPRCGVYHEGRLWLSGAVGNRIDGSKSSNIFNFAPTSAGGVVADDNAISYTFDATDVNAIFWMIQDQQGIVCGTQAGEWLVQATNNNNALTPSNIQAHRVTKIGCANVEPRRSDHTILFVQRQGRKVMEYFADVYSGKFSAPTLSDKAKHLAKPGLVEVAWQQELAPVLWARRSDGALIGCTYRRDSLASSQGPTFAAWHRHTLGSGRNVESICVGPSSDGTLQTLGMVTNDPLTGVRHVEAMDNLFEEGSALVDAFFLDDAVDTASYTTATVLGGASGVVISGLWHLNDQSVTVFAGGLDLGEWTVASGSVSVPFGGSLGAAPLFTTAFVSSFNGAMPIVVGFGYTSQGQLLRPDTVPESGARNGPGFGKVRRVHKYAALLVDTQSIYFGTEFTRLSPAQLKTTGGTLLAANVLFSGVHKDAVGDASEGFDGRMAWQVTRPFPATVASIGGFLHTQDE